jgi:hypothetical protein
MGLTSSFALLGGEAGGDQLSQDDHPVSGGAALGQALGLFVQTTQSRKTVSRSSSYHRRPGRTS